MVLQTGSMPVPAGHQMVDLKLADGREVQASPGHPTTDGRLFGQLRAGDAVAGTTVTAAKLQPYYGSETFDILPSGETGFYIADGVPVASTLDPANALSVGSATVGVP